MNLRQLLSHNQNNNDNPYWGETELSQTPEEEDAERLEQSIREVFDNKQLLNKALTTFLSVVAVNTGVSLMSSLGIGAIASVPLGSLVFGLFLTHALTKIQYDGQLHFDKEFIIATAQAGSVGVALWWTFDEHRAISHASSTGKKRFYQEVREYELKPVPSDNHWVTVGLVAVVLLLLVNVLRGRKG